MANIPKMGGGKDMTGMKGEEEGFMRVVVPAAFVCW